MAKAWAVILALIGGGGVAAWDFVQPKVEIQLGDSMPYKAELFSPSSIEMFIPSGMVAMKTPPRAVTNVHLSNKGRFTLRKVSVACLPSNVDLTGRTGANGLPELKLFSAGIYEPSESDIEPNKTLDVYCPAPEPKPLFDTRQSGGHAINYPVLPKLPNLKRSDKFCFEPIRKSETQTEWQSAPCDAPKSLSANNLTIDLGSAERQ